MSNAEKLSQNRYPTMAEKYAFIDGYEQAEKDLELTWEDISKIISIDQQVCGVRGVANYTYNHQQAMEEVLKQFKERKGGMYKTWNSLRGNLKEDNQGNIVGGLKL